MKKVRPYNPRTPISTRSAHNNRRTLEEYYRREQEMIKEGKMTQHEADSLRSVCYLIGGAFIVLLAILGYVTQ